MNDHTILYHILIYLSAAVIAVPIFSRLGLGSVLGYLVAGAVIGPAGLQLVGSAEHVSEFAEFGVVFLLFLIGIELSPRRLWVMRKTVFGLGAFQVAATGLVIAIVALATGFAFATAIVIGVSFSLSSTAFALQILSERGELHSHFGRKSFGILLFQDLAAIPLLALVPLLGQSGSSSQGSIWSAMSAFLVLAALILFGRYFLRFILRRVAIVRTGEVFTAAALLLVLGTALIMKSVGVSMALGAFLAGVVLADSEYRHELEANIEPFKRLLLGLFFVSVGMAVNFRILIEHPFLILGLVLGLVLVKGLVLYLVGIKAGLRKSDARSLALTISQGGEFAFVVFGGAVTQGLVSESVADIFVLVVTLSMVLTPLLMMLNDIVFKKFLTEPRAPYDEVEIAEDAVLIAGFGRVGQIAGRVLRAKGIEFTALEKDPAQVDVLRKFGHKVYYGDASRLDLLQAAGAHRAKIMVLAIDDMETSLKTAALVRKQFPHIKILARARNREHVFELMSLGIQSIYRETFGTSLEITHDLLLALGLAPAQAQDTVDKFREHDGRTMAEQAQLRKAQVDIASYSKEYARQLSDLLKTDQQL